MSSRKLKTNKTAEPRNDAITHGVQWKQKSWKTDEQQGLESNHPKLKQEAGLWGARPQAEN